jgi:para-aminobenzoate synthetase component 1
VIHKVRRTRISGWVDPAAAFLALASEEPWSVWLDAGPKAVSGWSYIAIPRSHVLSDDVETGLVTRSTVVNGFTVDSHEQTATIFEVVRADLATRILEDIESPGFHLGWVGWFGYGLAAHTTGVRTITSRTPDARLVFLDRALEFDHDAHTVTLLELADEDGSWQTELEALLAPAMAAANAIGNSSGAAAVLDPPAIIPPDRVTWRHSPQRYEALVSSCLEAITRGDAYQLCLTNEVRIAAVDGEPLLDPVSTYLRLRNENPSHHGGLLRFGDVSLLSSSPEVFLSVSAAGRVLTKPIKGTRRRGHSSAEDQALAAELLESEKERAENLMIVDLMRNDLGRVAQLGTVNVDALFTVETYENVHQLVSTISAQLLSGMSAADALEAAFPAGSMTGAPKISAMNILSGLEQGPRGIYSGAFGYLSLDGSAELAMVIRSIVLDASGASIGTGGGITSGSTPHDELEETWVKVTPLLRALGVSTLDYS